MRLCVCVREWEQARKEKRTASNQHRVDGRPEVCGGESVCVCAHEIESEKERECLCVRERARKRESACV